MRPAAGTVRDHFVSDEDVRHALAASLPPISCLAQVAAYLGRTPKALRHAIARGAFPPGRWIAGRRCWAHDDLVSVLVETAPRPSHPKAKLVKVRTRPAPHDPEHRVQVDIVFDCNDPRSTKPQPLRIQKTVPAGVDVASAESWARENAERFLAERLRKTTMKEPEESPRSQPKTERHPEITAAVTLADMFEQMADRVIIHEEPTTQDTWQSIWRCHLKPRFGETPIERITRTRILEYREALQKRYAATTCNHIIAKLQGILSYAVEMEKLATAPKIGRLKSQDAAEKDPLPCRSEAFTLASRRPVRSGCTSPGWSPTITHIVTGFGLAPGWSVGTSMC